MTSEPWEIKPLLRKYQNNILPKTFQFQWSSILTSVLKLNCIVWLYYEHSMNYYDQSISPFTRRKHRGVNNLPNICENLWNLWQSKYLKCKNQTSHGYSQPSFHIFCSAWRCGSCQGSSQLLWWWSKVNHSMCIVYKVLSLHSCQWGKFEQGLCTWSFKSEWEAGDVLSPVTPNHPLTTISFSKSY